MAITRTQAVSATANNVAISSTTAGDLIVVWSYFAGTATIPSLAAGYTNVVATAGTAQAARLAYKVSSGGDTSSGTWTNATQVVCMVYSGAGKFGTVPTITAGNSATLTYSAVTLIKPDGTSVILGFGGASSATAGMGGSPGSGVVLVNRTNQVKANGCDSSTTASSMSAQTLVVTTSGRWQTVTIELRTPNTPSLTAVLGPAGSMAKRSKIGGYVATLSFAGNFTKARTFFQSFTSNLFPVSGIGIQTVTDNFNRADQTPLAGNWTQSTPSDFKLFSNAVKDDVQANDVVAYYNPWTGGNNHYSQVEITTVGSGSGIGPGVCVRKTTSATLTYYRLVLDASGAFELSKIITGTFTSLRTGAVSYVAGQKLGLSVNGTTLKIWYNGAQVGTDLINSDISTGAPGLAYSSTSTSIIMDNWDAGTAVALGPLPVLGIRTNKAFSAVFSFVGVMTRGTLYLLSSTLSFIGTIPRSASRSISATLSFVGSTSTLHLIVKSLSATLSFVGSLATGFIAGSQQYIKSLTGVLSFVGSNVKSTTQTLAGTLSFSGALVSIYAKLLVATLAFSGTISRGLSHVLTGTLSFVANFTTSFSHVGVHNLSMGSFLDFSGGFTRRTSRSLGAVLSFIGTFRKQRGKLLSGLLSFSESASGNVLNSNGSASDTQAKINSAVNGDTVLLPASGSFTWAADVTIPSTKAITLDLNGRTITLSGANNEFEVISPSSGTLINRVTNGSIVRGSGYNPFVGPFQISDTRNGAGVRVDNIAFTGANVIVEVAGKGKGVMDHCTFTGVTFAQEFVHITAWGPSDTTGWTTDTGNALAGSQNLFYFEDCTFIQASGQAGTSWIQGYYGCRTAFRNNLFNHASVDMHGTGNSIGARWWEFYNNTWINTVGGTGSSPLMNMRGGSGVCHDNSATGIGQSNSIQLCEEDSGYPADYQIGRGLNQTSDPAYVWSNTNVDLEPDECDAPEVPGMVQLGRDVFASPRPSYTAFTYPHPLQLQTTSSGILIKQTQKTLAAIRSFVGSLVALSSHVGGFFKSFSANLVFAGNISRGSARRWTATLSFVGVFTRGTVRLKSLTATLWGNVNTILNSYSETNFDATYTLPSSHGIGQTFNSGLGGTLDSCKFVLFRTGLPSGTIVAKLYASTGTFGTDSHPTGTALAISDTIVATTLPTPAAGLITFSFTGANRVIMSASTVYCIVVEYPAGTGGTIDIGRDQSSPSAPGNICVLNFADVWAGQSFTDACFYVYIEGGTAVAATLKLRTGKSFIAVRDFSGDLVRYVKKSLRSTLSFVGGLDSLLSTVGGFVVNVTSSLLLIGNLNKDSVRKLPASTLSFSATVFRRTVKDLIAFLVTSGSLTVTFGFQQLLTATLSFVGSLTSSTPFRQLLTATLSFTGNLGRTFTKKLAAVLLFTGQLVKQTNRVFRSTLSFIGILVGNFVGDFRYYINLRPGEFKPTKTTFRTTEAGSSNFRNVKTDDDS